MKRIILLTILLVYTISHHGQNSSNDSITQSKAYKTKGVELLNDGKHFSAVKEFKSSLRLLSNRDLDGKIRLLNLIAGSYTKARAMDSAEYYFLKVDKLCTDSVSNYLKSLKFFSKAAIELNKRVPDDTMIYLLKSLDYAKLSKDKQLIASIYSNLGVLFLRDENFLKAGEYFDKCYDTAIESKDSITIGYATDYKGIISFYKKDYETAEISHRTSLDIFEKTSCDFGIWLAKGNLSKALFFQGDFIEANKLAFEMLPLASKMEFNSELTRVIDNTNEIAKIYNATDSIHNISEADSTALIEKAKEISNENIEILKKEDLLDKNILIALEDGKQRMGVDSLFNEELSNEFKIMIEVQDSIYQHSLNAKYKEFEKKYKTQEKEKENLQLQNEAKERELVLAEENRQKWIFGIGLVGALITLGVFTFFYRRNKKQKQIIEKLQKEMHHRIKNNLAIINAFIDNARNQSDKLTLEDNLSNLQNRIDSIYQIHRLLNYNKDISQLKIRDYIAILSKNVQKAFLKEEIEIVINIDSSLHLNSGKSFPVGIIVNEFITNSYKYAFKERSKGQININIQDDNNFYYLLLTDNGIGLPLDFNIKTLKSYGFTAITLLIQQLKGTYLLENNNGVTLKIKFPKV